MDDFFSPSNDASADPAADFLARERAALGETFGDAPNSARPGADKDYERSAAALPDLDGAGGAAEDDLDFFGGDAPSAVAPTTASHSTPAPVSVTNHTELAAFEQEYPEIDLPSETPQQNGFHAASAPAPTSFQPQQPTSSFQQPTATEEESEFIKSWRSKQQEEIARREETSKAKREETIVKAQNAIDNFYKEYNQKKEKSIAHNKDEEAAFNAAQTDALAKGTTWERICALVDLNDSRSKTSTKSKQDLARFKEVLLSLKREGENAPGAAGY